MTPADYILAARVPASLPPQDFGLWSIERVEAGSGFLNDHERALHIERCGFPDYVLLRRDTLACEMGKPLEIVMDDSALELRKHVPIWLAARGRVLVTGLGLGCVVRGLLAKPEVDHVDVVEIDPDIIKVVGAEFRGDPRVTIYRGDALSIALPAAKWDFAWHDIWCEGDGLQRLHFRLMRRFKNRCGPQGAWAFPRWAKRHVVERANFELLGASRRVHRRRQR